MKYQLKIIVSLALVCWSTGASPASASAQRAAEQAVRIGKPFLYTSGGFVCSPKYDAEYQNLAKGLPVQSLACGFVITGMTGRRTKYALQFNNAVLATLKSKERE